MANSIRNSSLKRCSCKVGKSNCLVTYFLIDFLKLLMSCSFLILQEENRIAFYPRCEISTRCKLFSQKIS